MKRLIYYLKNGFELNEVYKILRVKPIYKEFTKFNKTCYETLNNCLYALFSSKSFEEAIKKVLSYGGDTDTNACIVGAMAEALYGVPDELIEQAKEKLPNEFIELLEEAYNKKNSKVK